MSYRLPDLLIKDRKAVGLVIPILLLAICALGVCRARQLVKQSHNGGAEQQLELRQSSSNRC
jgi:hypothetical protein